MSDKASSSAVAASSRSKVNMSNLEIRQIWADNFEREMTRIELIKRNYPYITVTTVSAGRKVETEFGDSAFAIILKTLGALGNYAIQIGLCLSDRNGNLPSSGFNYRYLCWELNVGGKFDIESKPAVVDEEHVQRLIDSDIEFGRLRQYGIQSAGLKSAFERMQKQSEGLVEVQWILVTGAYDLGHILNLLVPRKAFPKQEDEFLSCLFGTFTRLYDLSHMVSVDDDINVNPQENEKWLDHAAEYLSVVRIGNINRAGSKALLGAGVFHEIKKRWSEQKLEMSMGNIKGLEVSYWDIFPDYPHF